MHPQISVIIPAYKARKFLPDCLESIGRQTLTPEEIIVIDDASPEPVDDIVASFASRENYPPVRLIRHKVNRGQAAGRNTGMNASTSEWLAFLDCDDIWAPNHLESLMRTLRESNADLAFCPAILFDEDPHDPKNYVMGPLTNDEKVLRPISILNRCFIVMSSTIIRREILRKAGGFDENPMMRGVEDLDCYMRLFRLGAKFRMDDEATLFYRKHPDSATETVGYLARQIAHVMKAHIPMVDGTCVEKKTILMRTHWRTAIQLWLVNAPDRVNWFFSALRHSLWSPYQCLLWIYRFMRSLYRHSSYGL